MKVRDEETELGKKNFFSSSVEVAGQPRYSP